MAFNRAQLVPLAGFDGDGPRLWSYKTQDAYSLVVDAVDYFLTAIDDLKLGDWVIVHSETDAAAGSSVVDLSAIISNDGVTIRLGTTEIDLGT